MKVTESYGKYTVEGCRNDTTNHNILRHSFSDFPSTNYANFYSTKRKSAKNASDSSLQAQARLSVLTICMADCDLSRVTIP